MVVGLSVEYNREVREVRDSSKVYTDKLLKLPTPPSTSRRRHRLTQRKKTP